MRNKLHTNTSNQAETDSGVSVSVAELLALRYRVERIDLAAKQRVNTLQVGMRSSSLRGRGIDFEEVRIYQPGDDIRHMDWRVTARTGTPHTKLYTEERERPIFLLVDFNPSMFFGTRVAFKSVLASQLAALIAWSAVRQGDRIGGLFFSGMQCCEFSPRVGLRGVLPILHSLAEHSQLTNHVNTQEDSLSAALKRVRRVARPGSLVFILSDFVNLDEDAKRHLSQLVQHSDVLAGLCFDPIEVDPPAPGVYTITDGEEFANLDTQQNAICEDYREYFQRQHDYINLVMRQHAIPLLEFSTQFSASEQLNKYFSKSSVRAPIKQEKAS